MLAIDLPRLPEPLPKPLEDVERKRLVEELPAATPAEKRDRAVVLAAPLHRGPHQRDPPARPPRLGPRAPQRAGQGRQAARGHVTARARDALDDYLMARSDPFPALFIAFHPGARSDAQARRANRLTARGARIACTQIDARLGISDLYPHRLRHALGTLVQEKLVDPRLTLETLGHVWLGSIAGHIKITVARRQAVRSSIEAAGCKGELALCPRQRTATAASGRGVHG